MTRRLGLIFGLTGCMETTTEQGATPFEDISASYLEDVRLITCIQYEVGLFGRDFETCKIILQFYRPSEPPPEPPVEIAEGECVYIAPDELEDRPMFNEVGIDAGEVITLHNDENSIELTRFEENGSVQYSLADCNSDNYPFGELFHVSVSGSSLSDGVPAFEVSNAILIGSEPEFQTSIEDASAPTVGLDYELSWVEPSLDTEAAQYVDRSVSQLTLENWLETEQRDQLRCTPTSTGLVIEDSVLSQLEAQNRSYLMVEWGTFGQQVDLPWGEQFSSYAAHTLRGDINWVSAE